MRVSRRGVALLARLLEAPVVGYLLGRVMARRLTRVLAAEPR